MTILNGQPIGDPTPQPSGFTSSQIPAPATDTTNLVMAVIALILAFAFPLAGIVLGGVAMAQARASGVPNPLAKIAFVMSIVFTILIVVVTIVAIIVGIVFFQEIFRVCEQLGNGSGTYNGVTYDCN